MSPWRWYGAFAGCTVLPPNRASCVDCGCTQYMWVSINRWVERLKRGSVAKNTCSWEDLDSVPSTHMAAHNYLYLQFQGIQWLLLASIGLRYTLGHIHTGRKKHPYTLKKKEASWGHRVESFPIFLPFLGNPTPELFIKNRILACFSTGLSHLPKYAFLRCSS